MLHKHAVIACGLEVTKQYSIREFHFSSAAAATQIITIGSARTSIAQLNRNVNRLLRARTECISPHHCTYLCGLVILVLHPPITTIYSTLCNECNILLLHSIYEPRFHCSFPFLFTTLLSLVPNALSSQPVFHCHRQPVLLVLRLN